MSESTMTQQKTIEDVWDRFHITRIPGHDMTNECRLAAAIARMELETADHLADLAQAFTIKRLVEESFGTAKAKGWHDPDPNGRPEATFPERLMLMVSELSEALEEERSGRPRTLVYYEDGSFQGKQQIADYTDDTPATVKPEGIPIELADVVIRIADACGRYGIDLDRALRIKLRFNNTRPRRHGGKTL